MVACLVLGFINNLAAQFSECPIECTEPVYNFGTYSMDQGDIEHDFILRNTGNEPVIFSSLNTTCGCTTAILTPEVIPPHTTATLRVGLTSSHPGGSNQDVNVFFDKGGCKFSLTGIFVSGGMISPEEQSIHAMEGQVINGDFEVIQYIKETSQSKHRLAAVLDDPLFDCAADNAPRLERDQWKSDVIVAVTKCRLTSKRVARMDDGGFHSMPLLTSYYENGLLVSTQTLPLRVQLKVKPMVSSVPPALVLPPSAAKPLVPFRIECAYTTNSVTRVSSTLGKANITRREGRTTYAELDCTNVPRSTVPVRGIVDVWVNDQPTTSISVPVLVLPRSNG
jgi:hypothetical protein